MSKQKEIHCCGCGGKVSARLTSGAEIYPHRPDLADLPFWKCDQCSNYVGCHHKNKNNPTQPLGVIPTPEIRNGRRHIHKILDPIWQEGRKPRGALYAELSEHLGWSYHTSKIRTIEEARDVYRYIRDKYGA